MRNKLELSARKYYRLYIRPKEIARKKLRRIDERIRDDLIDQLLKYKDRKKRGLKVNPVLVPESLIRKYEKILIDMVKRYRKNGREIGRLRKEIN